MATAALASRHGSRILGGICSALIVVLLAGCATKPSSMTTGSIPRAAQNLDQMSAPELANASRQIGAAYGKNPKDRDIGLSYANVLMMTGHEQQALAVMQQVAIAHPTDRDVLAAFGKAQAAAGQFDQALTTIRRAQTPDRPDWKLLSAEGAVLDQLGRSDEARNRYKLALDIKPNDPSILSNLGMSFVLSGDLKKAETYLRNAANQPTADSRVRQNLALVVGLQGRFDEAQKIAANELTPEQATANLTYLRSMLARQNSWKELAAKDKADTQATN
ncbi:tetratricopeptide repeat protein [Rhizobium halophytocola]|uniref:Flp pilus assembly protein TadD n=1 Tax=Rhizobium halophytocola TaxID=735519 RepID=A0ABS4E1E2_9HYPH|nr:tetratricopeptide repeat protein [Rhizobium halophytocola]MBP1851757.1 Flp pilus assembly protein TadD [Rhizobium halophytocola]